MNKDFEKHPFPHTGFAACAGTVLSLLLSTLCVSAIEIPLEYRRYPDDTNLRYPAGARNISVSAQNPFPDNRLPELKGKTPLFGVMNLGDSRYRLVLDVSSPQSTFYDLLYVDVNGNGDLTDDKPLSGKRQAQSGSWVRVFFDSLDLAIQDGQATASYCVKPALTCNNMLEVVRGRSRENLKHAIDFYVSAHCCYAGELDVGGVRHTVTIMDTLCNGRFTDTFSLPPEHRHANGAVHAEGDRVYISENSTPSFYDGMILCKQMCIESNLYDVTIDIPSRKLLLAPCTNQTSIASPAMPTRFLTIYSAGGDNSVMMFYPAERVPLKTGKYRVFQYNSLRTDKWGDLWRLIARCSADAPETEVRPGAVADISFGEPYRSKAIVSSDYAENWARSGGKALQFSFETIGIGKDSLDSVLHIKGDKTRIPLYGKTRPRPPRYKVTTPDGKVLAQGNFEYG